MKLGTFMERSITSLRYRHSHQDGYLYDPEPQRRRRYLSHRQVSKVVAIPTATTAVLEIPLYWNYVTWLEPQATRIAGITSNAGIED